MTQFKKPNKPKKTPTGPYAVGYCQPPKAGQFKPGQSGNPSGLPKGLPSPQQVLLEQAAKMVKVKIGDQIVEMSKQQGLLRRLLDLALGGDIAAIRLSLAYLMPAHAEAIAATPDIEQPLTDAELAVLAIMSKPGDDDNG
jgi:hypothetical protein